MGCIMAPASRILPLAAAASLSLLAGHAVAEELKLSGSAQLATDYMSKGTSKNGREPALSGSLEASWGDLYVGTWGSDAVTAQGGDAELHLYAGARPRFAGFKWDLRAMAKTIPGTIKGVQESYAEFRVDASRPLGPLKTRVRVEYSPDNYGGTEQAWWVEGQLAYDIHERLTASAALGRREQDGGADYTAWNAGAQVAITDSVALDLRWYDTDSHELGRAYAGQAVAAISLKF
jgi:uncharacterized protein (TIGR02001 family)